MYKTDRYYIEDQDQTFCEFKSVKLNTTYNILFKDSSDYAKDLAHKKMTDVIFDKKDSDQSVKGSDPEIFETIENEIDWFATSNNSLILCICSDKDCASKYRHRLFTSNIKKSKKNYLTFDIKIILKNEDSFDEDFLFLLVPPNLLHLEQDIRNNVESFVTKVINNNNKDANVDAIGQ